MHNNAVKSVVGFIAAILSLESVIVNWKPTVWPSGAHNQLARRGRFIIGATAD
jgi:hypothetical protein